MGVGTAAVSLTASVATGERVERAEIGVSTTVDEGDTADNGEPTLAVDGRKDGESTIMPGMPTGNSPFWNAA